LSIPNIVTLFRILLIPVFFTCLVSYGPGKESLRLWALWIFILASLTDALDGILARALKQRTPTGAILDPVADKLLLLSGYIGLLFVTGLAYQPPLWITVTIIFRDLVLGIGFFVVYFISLKSETKPPMPEIAPNLLGKFTTAFQMSLLALLLLEWKIAIPVAYFTAVLTIASGVVYVSRGMKRIT